MSNIIKIAFCFALLSLSVFVRMPVLAYDFSGGEWLAYDYGLQFIVCYALGLFFSKNYISFAAILYIVMGLIGFPLFANGGGLSYFFEPSFGYLLALIPLALFSFLFKNLDGFLFFPRTFVNNASPFAMIIAHAIGFFWILFSGRLTEDNFLSLSLYQFIYDMILVFIFALFYARIPPRQEIEE